MTTLTPLILQNASLLRALADLTPPETVTALAKAIDRDQSNVSKSLKSLEADGLISRQPHLLRTDCELWITDDGRAAVAALDRAENGPAVQTTFGDLPDGYDMLRHDEIAADPLNPRADFDAESLEELAGSILADGLLENLVVRRPDTAIEVLQPTWVYRLVAGERRWRAIGLLIARGQWPADQAIPCKVMDLDDAAHVRIALIENLQRRDLKPLEEARGFKRLIEEFGFTTATIAEKINFTQRLVQQRLQLLELPPIKQIELEAGKLTIEDARRFLAAQPTLREDITPAEWLFLAEIAEASAAQHEDRITGPVFCQTPDDTDEAAAIDCRKLRTRPGMILGPYEHYQDNVATGFSYVRLIDYGPGPEQFRLKFGDLADTATRQAHIMALRAEVLGEGYTLYPDAWATGLLNGDFTLTDEVRQKIEQAKLDRLADQVKRDNQAKAATEAKALAIRAAVERIHRIAAFEAVLREDAAVAMTPRIADLFGEVQANLPWFADDDGEVVDCAGVVVMECAGWNEDVTVIAPRNRLIVAILNATNGLATPAEKPFPRDPDAPPREAFVEQIAAHLRAADETLAPDKAAIDAERGLAQYLRDEETAYPHEDYDWSEDGARAIAQGILDGDLDGDLGAPADDPDAADDDDDSGEGGAPADPAEPPEDYELAPGDDAEIPGFLRRLAGADDEPQPEAVA